MKTPQANIQSGIIQKNLTQVCKKSFVVPGRRLGERICKIGQPLQIAGSLFDCGVASEKERLRKSLLLNLIHHMIKERQRLFWIIARPGHQFNTHTIRLGFKLAGVTVNGGDGPGNAHKPGHFLQPRGVEQCMLNSSQQRRLVPVLSERPQRMALDTMDHFMCQNSGQLIFVVQARQKPGMDIDYSVRICESIQIGIFDDLNPQLQVSRYRWRPESGDDAI